MQSPPFRCYLVPPRSKYSPQHHVLKHPLALPLPLPLWNVASSYESWFFSNKPGSDFFLFTTFSPSPWPLLASSQVWTCPTGITDLSFVFCHTSLSNCHVRLLRYFGVLCDHKNCCYFAMLAKLNETRTRSYLERFFLIYTINLEYFNDLIKTN